jgi:predicted ATPase
MIHLQTIGIEPPEKSGFPFEIPALTDFAVEIERPVTFFVGENGSGKSTILEGLACATRTIGVGAHPVDRDPTLDAVRPLAGALRLAWNRPVHRGFFMRAEDFFGFVNRVKSEQAAFEREAARVRAENRDMAPGDLARMLGPHTGSAHQLRERYGDDIDARSHGEQFLAFFRSRIVPGGLYLLDEPEVALSPTSQLAFLSLLIQAVGDDDCQFIIATHSPMLMAFPDAAILDFDHPPVRRVPYEDVEHVKLTKEFLESPGRFLRHL